MRRFAIPTALTAAGLLLGAGGLATFPDPLSAVPLLLSLLLDTLDGRAARALHAESMFGRELDWHTDVALAHVGAFVALGPAFNVMLVLGQAAARSSGRRVSGRCAVFVVLGAQLLT